MQNFARILNEVIANASAVEAYSVDNDGAVIAIHCVDGSKLELFVPLMDYSTTSGDRATALVYDEIGQFGPSETTSLVLVPEGLRLNDPIGTGTDE